MNQIQHCFGEYEKDFCQGNPNSEDFAEQLPCKRRDVCEAFQLYLKEAKKERVDYFEIEQQEDEDGNECFYAAIQDIGGFLDFCGKLVERYGTQTETIKKKHYRVVEKSTSQKRKGYGFWKRSRERRTKRIMKDRWKDLSLLFEKFEENLSARLPLNSSYAKSGIVPLPGQLYSVKTVEVRRHGIIYVNMKGYAKKDFCILRVRPRYIERKFVVFFLFQEHFVRKHIGKEISEFLELKQHNWGCKTKLLDDLGMDILATGMARFVKNAFVEKTK